MQERASSDEDDARVKVRKAYRKSAQEDPVPDLNLVATDEFPPGDPAANHRDWARWEQTRRSYFEEDALAIARALAASLPQGTIDRLLIELLQRRASTLIVTGTTIGDKSITDRRRRTARRSAARRPSGRDLTTGGRR